jgi:hypothetical protein
MKLRKLLLGMLTLSLIVSCGEKKNSSGGGSSDKDNKTSKNRPGFTNSNVSTSVDSTKTYTYSHVSNKIKNKSLTSGLQRGFAIYFIGPEYQPSGSIGFEATGRFCVDFLGLYQAGDCDQQSYYMDQQNLKLIENGMFFVYEGGDSSSINYGIAYDSTDGEFDFDYKVFTRSDDRFYKNMLNLYSPNPEQDYLITGAEVKLDNNQKIEAYMVEYFDTGTKYIISPAVPVFANPIAVIDQNGQTRGALHHVGNTLIKEISYHVHEPQYSYYTGFTQPTVGQQTQGQKTIKFNDRDFIRRTTQAIRTVLR